MKNKTTIEEILTQTTANLEKKQAIELFASGNRRVVMFGETIQPGDEYIYKGAFEPRIYLCKAVCPFSKKLQSTDIFATEHKPQNCYKVVPIPRVNETTIHEKLQLIQDELASLRALILRQNRV